MTEWILLSFRLRVIGFLVQAHISMLDLFMNYRVSFVQFSESLFIIFCQIFLPFVFPLNVLIFCFVYLAKITHEPRSQNPLPSIAETMESKKAREREREMERKFL